MSNTVAVRLPDEVLKELQRLAALQNKKVSDIVRELIVSGLTNAKTGDQGDTSELATRLDNLEQLGLTSAKAALKAQFLANMSASFSVDVSRLMGGKTAPTKDEKDQFLAQMDGWAEEFANGTLFGPADEPQID